MTDHDLLVRVDERLNGLYKAVEDLDEKLFGNGQRGEIKTIKERIYTVERSQWKWVLVFVILAASVVGTSALKAVGVIP